MFPDPTLKWKPYPSIIDGTENIYAIDAGYQDGTLFLIIYGLDKNKPQPDATPHSLPPNTAFLVEIECDSYTGIDEFLYTVSGEEGSGRGYNNKDVYIKEATNSP